MTFIDVKSKGAKKASNEFKNLNKNVNGLSSSVKKLAVVFGAGVPAVISSILSIVNLMK